MSRLVRSLAIVCVAAVPPAGIASAQHLSPAPARPDLRVRFDRPADAPARELPRLAAASRRRGGIGDRLELNIHGGLGLHGTGGFLDDACDVIDDLYLIEGFTGTDCGGRGGSKTFNLGAFLSYRQPLGSVNLHYQGGWAYHSRNEVRLDSQATYSDFDAELTLTGGVRFDSHTFYGGGGVEWNNLFVGGKIGMNHHSGEQFISQRLVIDGQVYDEFEDEEPTSATKLLVGLRVMYMIVPGVRLYLDWDCYDIGDFYDEFDEEDFPPQLRMPVRDRTVSIGVSFNVFSYFR
jgi:hypothetical protein